MREQLWYNQCWSWGASGVYKRPVREVEKGAYKLTLRSLYYNTQEAKDIEFEQTATGFVRTTGGTMRKSLRRSMRYMTYAPIEIISNFTHKVFHSLSEIEE